MKVKGVLFLLSLAVTMFINSTKAAELLEYTRTNTCTLTNNWQAAIPNYGPVTCAWNTKGYLKVGYVQITSGGAADIIFYRRPQTTLSGINLSMNPGAQVGYNSGSTIVCNRQSLDKRIFPCKNPWPDMEVDIAIKAYQKGIPVNFQTVPAK